MKSIFLLPLLIWLSTAAVAHEGGWSSGGGGLLKDSVNPWFLNNVSEVRYCIKIDEMHFGLSPDQARTQVVRALDFWQIQFRHAVLPKFKGLGQLEIASQKFVEVSCDAAPDLAFQLGVISELQKKYLGDPGDYGAISVRTSYDKINLRGKGFVYVSPTPLRQVNAEPRLYLTLLHELGHVFGIPHMGSQNDLMSQGFVESLMGKEPQGKTTVQIAQDFFTLRPETTIICPSPSLLKTWQTYFETSSKMHCFKFFFSHDSKSELFGKTELRVEASEDMFGTFNQVAIASLSMDRFFPVYTSEFWLPKEQNVMKDRNGSVLGISLLSISKSGTLSFSNSKMKRFLSLRIDQGTQKFSIDGVLDGKIVPLL